MKASLRIEAIGDDTYSMLRSFPSGIVGKIKKPYWVAEIIGAHPKLKYERKFLKGKKDYAKANSKGSRGVFVYYLLESDRIYEVSRPVSWKKSERFFCVVSPDDGEIVKVEKDFVDQCLKSFSELALTRPPNNA